MSLPGSFLANPRWQGFDSDGDPLPGCLLYSWATGGTFTTPKSLWTTSALNVAHTNPVVADAGGRFATMFLDVGGYDLQLKDANDVLIATALNIEAIGQSFLSELGVTLSEGAKSVNTGYTIIATDNFITIDENEATNPCVINLQAAADRGLPLGIKNLAPVPLSITPDGAETIEGLAAVYTVTAAASPNYPAIWLVSDGVSGYWILASHGL